MSDVVDAYHALRSGGTSHADAIDVLMAYYGLDRPTLRNVLERGGVMYERALDDPPARTRAEYLERRPRGAKYRRRRGRRR